MPVRSMKLLVIAAKAIQMMLLEHKLLVIAPTAVQNDAWGMTLFVIAAKAVQMMSLKHETARYSRKSRPNDASETSKADQMMPQKHHLDGYVKGLSRGQPWVCDPQESRNSSWAPWVDMRRVYLVIAVVIAHKSRPNDASEAWNCSL